MASIFSVQNLQTFLRRKNLRPPAAGAAGAGGTPPAGTAGTRAGAVSLVAAEPEWPEFDGRMPAPARELRSLVLVLWFRQP